MEVQIQNGNGEETLDPVIVKRLIRMFGAPRLEQLADLIEDVSQETGYGDVKIVIAERRVVRLKVEKSY